MLYVQSAALGRHVCLFHYITKNSPKGAFCLSALAVAKRIKLDDETVDRECNPATYVYGIDHSCV